MAVHRVFIFWTHPLFREAVQLLLAHPEIEWVGSSSNYSGVNDLVASSSPDTILVEEEAGSLPAGVMRVLETSQVNVRVVGLNLHNNQMHTYHRVERVVGKAEDLLHWILSDSN